MCHYVWRPRALVVSRLSKSTDLIWFVCIVHDEQPVRIQLTDVNDELPVFRNVPRPFLTTVATNSPPGTSVYQLLAQDADEESVVRYTLESGRLCDWRWLAYCTASSCIVYCRGVSQQQRWPWVCFLWPDPTKPTHWQWQTQLIPFQPIK